MKGMKGTKGTKRRFSLPRIDPAQASQLVAVVLAMVVVILINVIGARRYTRWDWTSNHRYTLTPATVQTLHDLPGTIEIWVLLGGADALEQSVKQLLVSYQAETQKLDVHYIDPDRDVAQLEDVKKRFKIETGRTEEGHVVADAIVVVSRVTGSGSGEARANEERKERHWFLNASDMVEVTQGDDTQVKPKEERALTGAIRNVLGSEKSKLCFTTGHGEMSPEDPGEQGAGMLKDLLVKDNYEIGLIDVAALNVPEPFAQCGVVVIAGLRGAFTKEEIERLRTYLLSGGNMLLAVSPITGNSDTGLVPSNLDRALSPFGIALDEDLVIEEDAEATFPGTGGMRFVAQPRPHALTAALVNKDDKRDVPRITLHFARSMRRAAEPGAANPADLLYTSKEAFGLLNVSGASEWKDQPRKKTGDLGGPLVVGMAAERPKISPTAPHGPRVVVIGSASALTSPTFREPLPMRGAALFVESAISWLASKPQILDVPDRTAVAAGIRITDDDRAAVRRYVLFLMPGTVALLGIAIGLWRRRTEGASLADDNDDKTKTKPKPKPTKKKTIKR